MMVGKMSKSIPDIIAELIAKELDEPSAEPTPNVDFKAKSVMAPRPYANVAMKGKTFYRNPPGARPKYPRYSIEAIDNKIEEL